MEGPAAAALLDDRIAAAAQSEQATPFSRDLSAIAGAVDIHIQSRRKAEAS
jgi:hypothetical protein